MQSVFLYSFIVVIVLIASFGAVYLWERFSVNTKEQDPSSRDLDGSLRSMYHVLWVLLFWSGIVLSLPTWLSFRNQIHNLMGYQRWIAMGKAAAFPIMMLLLLQYGRRKKYIGWIDTPSWPNERKQ